MFQLLRSKPVIDGQIDRLKNECLHLIKNGVRPSLKVFLVGNNPSSVIYTQSKKTFCEKIGASCEIIKLPQEIKACDFVHEVKTCVSKTDVHGALIQLPVPTQLMNLDLTNLVPSKKDVDGFHQENIMGLFKGDKGENCLIPCTPKGIVTLMSHYNIELEGKNICIIGRSHIVGRPLALLLTNYNATVSLCHSRTQHLEEYTSRADIIISAAGKENLITKNHIGDNRPIVVDVGTNINNQGKLMGDVKFDEVAPLCSFITPVPGGVGPMTVFSVAENLLLAASYACESI